MSRDEILSRLRDFKRECAEEYGIIEIGIFGSVARNEAGADSDVDIVFQTFNPNLFQTARMKLALESLLARPVDVMRWRANMDPRLKTRIARDALYV